MYYIVECYNKDNIFVIYVALLYEKTTIPNKLTKVVLLGWDHRGKPWLKPTSICIHIVS